MVIKIGMVFIDSISIDIHRKWGMVIIWWPWEYERRWFWAWNDWVETPLFTIMWKKCDE